LRLRAAFEDVEMVQAQLERAVLGSPPQRSGEDLVKMLHLESVVLVSRHPCDQTEPDEDVQNGVDRRRGHGDD